ncbi:MAG TPA: type II toxin-antitoxin system VapC family toxin [Thermoanaerobaculia bacterium]|nr:type II toxin-antitoxin system VapC family toxin [Thermoanaerobaculia bacterium]
MTGSTSLSSVTVTCRCCPESSPCDRNFTAYDAVYVTLAEQLGAAVLTADGRLARAIRTHLDLDLDLDLASPSSRTYAFALVWIGDGSEADSPATRSVLRLFLSGTGTLCLCATASSRGVSVIYREAGLDGRHTGKSACATQEAWG